MKDRKTKHIEYIAGAALQSCKVTCDACFVPRGGGVELSICKRFGLFFDKWKALYSQALSDEVLKNQLPLQVRGQGEGLTRRESIQYHPIPTFPIQGRSSVCEKRGVQC